MADTYMKLLLQGLNTGSPYTLTVICEANKAIGLDLPTSPDGLPTANSPLDWEVPEMCQVNDILAGPATGMFEFISAGRKTGVIVDNAAHQVSNSGRPSVRHIRLAPGRRYRLRVINTFPA